MITDEQVANALDRIARTDDGWLLYLSLERTMLAVMDTADSGALLAHNGQRILASRIRSLMSKGIEESGRGAEHVITFAVAGARAVSTGPRGAGRRGPGADGSSEPDARTR
jgi:hypothetical protein